MTVCTIPELRQGLEMAQTLAKAHMGFVVLPVMDRADFERMSLLAARRFEELAKRAEAAQ